MDNVEIARQLCEAFRDNDRKRLLEILEPEIEWIQNEGFPHGGRHVGAETVLDDVFVKFRREWKKWRQSCTSG